MKGVVWAWLRLLIGVGIIGVLLWRLGTRAFLDGLRVIDVREVSAALAIGLATTVFSAWRWRLVAQRLGLRLPLRKGVADYYGALFLNAVLPAGVLGDVHRAVRHGRQEGDVGRGVRAVVLERVAGQVVVVAVAVPVLLARPTVVPAPYRDVVTVTGAVVVVLAIAVTAVAVMAPKRWARSGSKWRRASAVSLDDLRRGLLARDVWPGVVLLSLMTFAGHLALFLVAARAAGSAAPVTGLLPLMVLTLLAMVLPVNVGGWGPREGVAALAFGAAGLGAAQGLTTAVVYGVLALVASLPGAAVLLRPHLAWTRSERPASHRIAHHQRGPRPYGNSAHRPERHTPLLWSADTHAG
ncbi:lysylphosphatidylglycerol synthase transmembrane domain-containing protein [Actinomadura alba]|uniref:Flippase-like domain-containing protein n=1 Tax=Actinomadura alba TaxID=406431 RepID=A0ABR7LZP3_9ACTN|nr:lysylphosphatidylglycerol synthase transmembrane domain-containing protein [Actinomadura alba]MBC6470231.1 flippase-like domain-containing protein [Actinomadura alba]